MISFDEFKKVEITVGKILSAEKVPETDKLLKLSVDFGDNTNVRTEDTKVRTETTAPQSPPSTPVVEQSSLRGKEGGEEIPRSEDGVLLTEAVHLSHPKTDAQGLAKLQAFASHPLEKGESERDIRQIISGIAVHFPEPHALVGRKCMFVTNIPTRMIKGLESNGMILAVSTEDGKFSLLEPSVEIPEGTRAK